MEPIRKIIESAYDERTRLAPDSTPDELRGAVNSAIEGLGSGEYRVAEKTGNGWQVNEWLKKAVLLHFRISDNRLFEGGPARYFDKVGLKYADTSSEEFRRQGVRVVPPAIVRKGACIAPDVVLMPSYVNIGAFVDAGSMIDTWATIGSCAQIGKKVHVSGGAGIGGVLEPVQAAPTIIEDDCFIGARSEIVEGVIVEHGSVVAMGVFIGQSTRIYDRDRDQVIYGRVPPGSVVVPGTLPADNGKYSLQCAVIVKRVDEATRAKTSINDLLRGAGV